MSSSVKDLRQPIHAVRSKKAKKARLSTLALISGLGFVDFGYVVFFGGLSLKQLAISIKLTSVKNVT